MSIKVNDKVKVVSPDGNINGRIGKVVRIYDFIKPIAIVEFDDCIAKIPVKAIEKVEPQKNQEAKNEIPEGAKKITLPEFMEAIEKITAPDKLVKKIGSENGILVGMSVIINGAKLAERLFKGKDTVVITKDQLNREITELALDEDPKFMVVALTTAMILKDIVDVIFTDESEND